MKLPLNLQKKMIYNQEIYKWLVFVSKESCMFVQLVNNIIQTVVCSLSDLFHDFIWKEMNKKSLKSLLKLPLYYQQDIYYDELSFFLDLSKKYKIKYNEFFFF